MKCRYTSSSDGRDDRDRRDGHALRLERGKDLRHGLSAVLDASTEMAPVHDCLLDGPEATDDGRRVRGLPVRELDGDRVPEQLALERIGEDPRRRPGRDS